MSDLPEFEAPPPYVPPPSEAPKKTIRSLGFADPYHWLRSGWADLIAQPGISGFYGVAFWLMAVVLGSVFKSRPEFAMSIASGCLLGGPFMAMGLFEVSRRRESGLVPDWASSLTCWDQHVRSMGMLILVLMVLELLWGRASLVVFAVFFNTAMPSTSGVMQAIFNPENLDFVLAYLTVGGAFASLVYGTTVVSMPMILDRDTDAISAVITSMEVVFANPGVMLVWGALIVTLVALSLLLPWGVGLLVSGPLLGHASWHAYRGAVEWPQDVKVA
jgi:uncharacterized membrane protein